MCVCVYVEEDWKWRLFWFWFSHTEEKITKEICWRVETTVHFCQEFFVCLFVFSSCATPHSPQYNCHDWLDIRKSIYHTKIIQSTEVLIWTDQPEKMWRKWQRSLGSLDTWILRACIFTAKYKHWPFFFWKPSWNYFHWKTKMKQKRNENTLTFLKKILLVFVFECKKIWCGQGEWVGLTWRWE